MVPQNSYPFRYHRHTSIIFIQSCYKDFGWEINFISIVYSERLKPTFFSVKNPHN